PKVDPFIWKRLRSPPFKLVHAHCPFSSGRLGVYVKKKQNVPLIGTFHSKYKQDLEHSFRHFPWCVPIIMKRILAFFNACDEVWIPQGYVEETVREYGYRGPLTVVENGNDFASIYKGDLSEVKRNAKKELGVKEDEISLLFVGQHIKEKGVDIILKTLKQLSGNVKFKMNFIGNGYYSGEMQEFIRHEGLDDKVTMHGIITDREELAKHYAAADLFLFPSFYDNAPLVVREAAALGTPSILLKGSTAAEVVQNGKNGFLVNRTPHEFASLITYLAQNRDEIGVVAAGARFSLVRSWEDVLEEVSERYKVIIDKYGRK
ncbi:MAG: glycosyltransferase, partial [Muribaculaceae bacterium]|nr:glycosyltransferase [Muribaculaceae bacterium]